MVRVPCTYLDGPGFLRAQEDPCFDRVAAVLGGTTRKGSRQDGSTIGRMAHEPATPFLQKC